MTRLPSSRLQVVASSVGLTATARHSMHASASGEAHSYSLATHSAHEPSAHEPVALSTLASEPIRPMSRPAHEPLPEPQSQSKANVASHALTKDWTGLQRCDVRLCHSPPFHSDSTTVLSTVSTLTATANCQQSIVREPPRPRTTRSIDADRLPCSHPSHVVVHLSVSSRASVSVRGSGPGSLPRTLSKPLISSVVPSARVAG